MRRLSLSVLILLAACQRTAGGERARAAPESLAQAPASSAATAGTCSAVCPQQRSSGEPAGTLPACRAGTGTLLERAVDAYDAGDFAAALACAVQAAAADPANADAHSERAAALVALGRYEEARVGFARALALDPRHPDALLGAADLYLKRLPAGRDHSELGLVYAGAGRAVAGRDRNPRLAAEFALLEASGLNDLGQGQQALLRAEQALQVGVDDSSARYEKALALWELCRFDEAEREFRLLEKDVERGASAHYHLGPIAEWRGTPQRAAREFEIARRLAPESFAGPVEISAEEFAGIVADAVGEQPPEIRRLLAGVEISTQDLPDLEDLVASAPPLSPEIIGLFRGPSLAEACPPEDELPGPCRAIVLYRRNLARAVRDRAQLEEQVRVTLAHEIGHLLGEDDRQLAARGLE